MAPVGTTARTGEICPESGVWKVLGTASTTAPIANRGFQNGTNQSIRLS